jgi:hypothetical protein
VHSEDSFAVKFGARILIQASSPVNPDQRADFRYPAFFASSSFAKKMAFFEFWVGE